MKDKSIYPKLRSRLLAWFDRNRRSLPWRTDYSPYEVWISEIMLQQTQVKTVLPYFLRWLERFPSVRSVAEAAEEEILKHWEGLGYYSRAGNIHKTAKILMRDFHGEFPRDHRKLLKLPGIGLYTAGAVMSFAFNEAYPAVDRNVERVFARVFNICVPVSEKETRLSILATAKELIPPGEARRFNQAIMELGAVLCTPRNPVCFECPISALCKSFQLGITDQRPVPGKRKVIVPIDVAVGVLVQKGKVFIQKRPASGLMAHLWEFPGGKLAPGETPSQALVREFREELELDVRCHDKIALIRHNYTSFKVTLHAYFCKLSTENQTPILHAAVDARWVDLESLDTYAFPAANRKLIAMIRESLDLARKSTCV
jgi:A/G-specific adenine glycosylase